MDCSYLVKRKETKHPRKKQRKKKRNEDRTIEERIEIAQVAGKSI